MLWRDSPANLSYKITLKFGASAEELDKYEQNLLGIAPHLLTPATRAKQTAIDQGGKITHESKLIKSTTYVPTYTRS